MPMATAPDGAQIYYEASGEGEPLLLISGTGWTGEHWQLRQVPFFEPAYRVITFDHRGTGRSDHPATDYSTRIFASDAIAILEQEQVAAGSVHVLGHSMGGRVAQWVCLLRPDLVKDVVFAASGPGPIGSGEAVTSVTPEDVAKFVRQGWPGAYDKRVLSKYMLNDPSSDLAYDLLQALHWRGGLDVESYVRHMIASRSHDCTARIKEICQPSLVIVGTEDKHQDNNRAGHFATSQALADMLPDSTFEIVDGAAHALHIEYASTFNDRVLAHIRPVASSVM